MPRVELTPEEAAMLDWFNKALQEAKGDYETVAYRTWLEEGRRLFVATLRDLAMYG